MSLTDIQFPSASVPVIIITLMIIINTTTAPDPGLIFFHSLRHHPRGPPDLRTELFEHDDVPMTRRAAALLLFLRC